ncbi:MAG: alkaline phosphatase family protein [Accumulibacter sp.]|jgi:hypothetical protein
MSTLLIFIDGLSFSLANERLSVLTGRKVYPITPGIGFSNNLYPEMLCGKTPDEIGYFNEWSPAALRSLPLPVLLRVADIFRKYLYINAGFRKIFLKRVLKRDYANIPFEYAHFFVPEGSHNFRDLKDGLLKDHKFKIYDAVDVKARVGNRDVVAIDKAEANLRRENTLISLVDLDNIAHIDGLQSAKFSDHIKMLDKRIGLLVRTFLELDPEANIFLFSDHGMADVSRAVYLDIESVAGKMAYGKYLYFIDSTFLRVWVKDEQISAAIMEYLDRFEDGAILTKEERIRFGISNPEFGDIIFRANEGILFLPNFYGARYVKAMHGYDSDLVSQTAFLAEVSTVCRSSPHPRRSKDVFTYLSQCLGEGGK